MQICVDGFDLFDLLLQLPSGRLKRLPLGVEDGEIADLGIELFAALVELFAASIVRVLGILDDLFLLHIQGGRVFELLLKVLDFLLQLPNDVVGLRQSDPAVTYLVNVGAERLSRLIAIRQLIPQPLRCRLKLCLLKDARSASNLAILDGLESLVEVVHRNVLLLNQCLEASNLCIRVAPPPQVSNLGLQLHANGRELFILLF